MFRFRKMPPCFHRAHMRACRVDYPFTLFKLWPEDCDLEWSKLQRQVQVVAIPVFQSELLRLRLELFCRPSV